jgi:hypothetical protein
MNEDQHFPKTTEGTVDWRKRPRNRPDKDEKHLAYSILIANGVQKEKAATMLGYSAKTVRSIDRALVKKGLKLVLLSEQRIKKAHRVIDKCLAGKPFGGVEVIKDSTALRAAEAILDRSDPKNQVVAPPPRAFVNVDLSIFLNDPPPEPKTIDLEPESASTTTGGIQPTRP